MFSGHDLVPNRSCFWYFLSAIVDNSKRYIDYPSRGSLGWLARANFLAAFTKYGSLTIADFVRYIVQYLNKNTKYTSRNNRRTYSSFRYVFNCCLFCCNDKSEC